VGRKCDVNYVCGWRLAVYTSGHLSLSLSLSFSLEQAIRVNWRFYSTDKVGGGRFRAKQNVTSSLWSGTPVKEHGCLHDTPPGGTICRTPTCCMEAKVEWLEISFDRS